MVMWWRFYTTDSNSVAVQKEDISTGSAGVKAGNTAAVMISGSLITRDAGVVYRKHPDKKQLREESVLMNLTGFIFRKQIGTQC